MMAQYCVGAVKPPTVLVRNVTSLGFLFILHRIDRHSEVETRQAVRNDRDLFRRGPSWIVLLLLASAGLLGCEEDLAPIGPYDLPFSLYGVITPDEDTQSVRLYPIDDFPTFDFPDPLDVVFSSTDLEQGIRRTWQDTIVVEPDGRREHVFQSPFRAEYGHRYRVEAVRSSDGAYCRADVRIPPPITVQIEDPDNPQLRVLFSGEDIQVNRAEVTYRVKATDMAALSFTFSYEEYVDLFELGREVVVQMNRDRIWAQSYYNHYTGANLGIERDTLYLLLLELNAFVGDLDWHPPGGIFEPDILSFPWMMNNVENGYGFVGGGYRISVYLTPSRKAIEKAGFKYYPW